MQRITLEDYRNFCSEQTNCESCPMRGDSTTGIFVNCMGYITEYPENSDKIIQDWRIRAAQKEKSLFLVIEKYQGTEESVVGVASTFEKAKQIINILSNEALADFLAADPSDTGIYWEEMSSEEKNVFYQEQIRPSWVIVERKIDHYIYDEEVYAI